MVWLACMALGCLSELGSERGILNGSCFFLYCLPVCTCCSSCSSSMGLICKFFLGTPIMLLVWVSWSPTKGTDLLHIPTCGVFPSVFLLLDLSIVGGHLPFPGFEGHGWRGSGGRGNILQRTLVSSSGYPAA